jgi:hypothetical protein
MCRCARLVGALGGVALVTACTIPPPSGPTVLAMPPAGKDLAVFQQEDGQCRSYAAATIGALPPGQATLPAPGSSAVGTGRATTALQASNATTGDAGATIGGAPGYAGDVAAGATYAASGAYDVQTRYNIAYTQCIYSSGNAVLPMPASVYGYNDFAGAEYPWYGDPWFEWAGLGFAGGGIFLFDRNHGFHHGFHGFHAGFHGGFHGGSHAGGMHGGGGHGRG